MRNRYLWLAIALPFFGHACADVDGGHLTLPPSEPVQSMADDTTLPDEQMWPVRIKWVMATPSFPSPGTRYPAAARLETAMSYNAHHSSIGATLWLGGETSDSRTFVPVERYTTQFYDNIYSPTFTMMVPSACGHTLDAQAIFRAWFMGRNGAEVDHASDQVRPMGVSQICDEGEKDEVRPYRPSGGGGEGDCLECVDEPADGYTWCKVRVKYWKDTGEIISVTTLYCW